jgi:hypothetical protein
MLNQKIYKDEVDIHENLKIAKLNSDIKRLPLFSHYIWTHDIHPLERTRQPHWSEDEKPEDHRIQGSKSQPYLERIHSTSNPKKEEEDDENKSKSKNSKKKTTSIEKLAGYFEKVDSLQTVRKPSVYVSEKIDEMVQEVTARRKMGILKYQEMYNELFGTKQDLQPATCKKNQEFLEKIKELQLELKPEIQKLPSIYDNSNLKQGSKSKPTKMSIEPSLLSSTRAKIQQMKEIEMKQKLKSKGHMSKVPFTLYRTARNING